MRPRWVPILVVLGLAPRAAWPQGNPVGPEFRANTYVTGGQDSPSVAADASGNFVVVWTSVGSFYGPWQDGSGAGVFGQRYASSGSPLGPEFRVNTYITSAQVSPSVSANGSGIFVVVWSSYSQDGSNFGVFGQRYASSGTPLGPEFRVNSYTTDSQSVELGSSVSVDASGNFVVVWTSVGVGQGQDGSTFGVFGQRYAAGGAPLGAEFRVNTYTTSTQGRAAVAADASGNFVVVWSGDLQDGSGVGVFGQRYAASGAPLGAEFRVNTYTTSTQGRAAVAADASGNFVVVWHSYTQDGSGVGVFGQRYASSGSPLGPEFRVNTYTTNFQWTPSVSADASGNFVVLWDSATQDGSGYGVFGQRYASSGAPLGAEFRVNTFVTSNQRSPSVAADPSGNFVVLWTSFNQDGPVTQDGPGLPDDGVFGQRFGPIVPVELMHALVE